MVSTLYQMKLGPSRNFAGLTCSQSNQVATGLLTAPQVHALEGPMLWAR